MRAPLFIKIVHDLLKHDVSETYYDEILAWVDDADCGWDSWDRAAVELLAEGRIDIVGYKPGDGPIFRVN